MLMSEYQIWYTGLGAHELRSMASADMLSHLSKSDNRRIAEWALTAIEFAGKEQTMRNILNTNETHLAHDYISKIHHDYQEDLEQNRFLQPKLSDEEVGELLIKGSKELEEIPKKVDAEITLSV